jgi:predicted amidophosphoribosyltransferase
MTTYSVEVIDHPEGPIVIRHPLCERCNAIPTYGDNAYCDRCEREIDEDDD